MELGCKNVSFFFMTTVCINYHNLVYRVNWLRAKARRDRWREELEIVGHEMEWTALWFEHQMKEWQQRLDESVKENKSGHIAYAEKQVAMWKRFIKEAHHRFKEMTVE
jgi:hypothetical protein